MEDKRMYECCECGCEFEIVGEPTDMEKKMMEEQMCFGCVTDTYNYCECCNEMVKREELNEVYDADNDEILYICEDCNERKTFWCEYHERYEIGHRMRVRRMGIVCETAYDWGDFFTCGECGEIYHVDDGFWDDDTEEYYCEDCYDEVMSNRVISGYHNHQDDYEYEKRTTVEDRRNEREGDKLTFFGMELEVEDEMGRMDKNDMAGLLQNITDDFVYEYDGSLNDGFEIISYPFTKNYMKEELQYDLGKMLDKLNAKGYCSENTCGLHFHITRGSWKHTIQMASIMEYYKGELTKLSKREECKIRRWSSFYTEDLGKSELCYMGVTKIGDELDECDSRYKALNIQNSETIEVRIFKGTTDIWELMARWELVNNFSQWCKDNTLEDDFDNIPSFYELATHDENNFIGKYLQAEFPELCDKKEEATF